MLDQIWLALSTIINQPEPKCRGTEQEVIVCELKEYPILIEISKCESGLRQTNEKGEVLRGKIDPKDSGAMQINKYWHEKDAKKLGYDLDTLEGNLQYAKYLYRTGGTKYWKASQGCWDKVTDGIKAKG